MKPRRWQTEALAAWRAAGNHGIISVVTGGGKTVFAIMAMKELVASGHIASVTILVPTVALQEQWWVALVVDGNIDPEQVSLVGGSAQIKPRAHYRIAVMASARTKMLAWDLTQSLLIVDECHRAGNLGMQEALQNRAKATLGLSATPEREYDDGLEEVLEPALGKIIYEYSYEEALKDGVISKFNLLNVRVPMSLIEQEAYDKFSLRLVKAIAAEKAGKIPEGTAARIAMARARHVNGLSARLPAALAIMKSIGERRTLIFEESVDRAHLVSESLGRLGFRAGEYHSGVSGNLRREYMRQFRLGILSVLVTVHALDEGFDVPEAEVALIVSSSATKRQRIQRLGRVLRSTTSKSGATIITLYATKHEEDRLVQDKVNVVASEVSWKEWEL